MYLTLYAPIIRIPEMSHIDIHFEPYSFLGSGMLCIFIYITFLFQVLNSCKILT